jgi:isoleucyl-tRNA synthetase
MLSLLAGLDATLRQAVANFDFNTYVRALSEFCNNDLSAFYFDIRKDTLYCEVNAETGVQTDKRRAYRTVLDTLFEALVRYSAPVLVFTSEEVWGSRWPEAGSVHLAEWPVISPRHSRESGNPAQTEDLGPRLRWDDEKWRELRSLRAEVNEAIEPLRRDKTIRSSLEADIRLPEAAGSADELAELFIVASVTSGETLGVTKTSNHKCGRCWRHLPEVVEDGDLCGRCDEVIHA